MSEFFSPETCYHRDCDFLARQEYCEIDPNSVEDSAGVLVDYIDHLLFEYFGKHERGSVYSADNESRTNKSSFVHYEVMPEVEYNEPIQKVMTDIARVEFPHGTTEYTILTNWSIDSHLYENNYPVAYEITVYPHAVGSSIKEFSPTMDDVLNKTQPTQRERAMTEYDYQRLFELLSAIERSETDINETT